MPNNALTSTAAMIVLAVWVATTVDGMLTGDYEGLQIVTPIVVILAGWLFARDFFVSAQNRRRKDTDH